MEFVHFARDYGNTDSSSQRRALLVRPAFYYPISDSGLHLAVNHTLKFGTGENESGFDRKDEFKFWSSAAFAGLALALGNASGGLLQFGLTYGRGGFWLEPGGGSDDYQEESELGFKTALGLFF